MADKHHEELSKNMRRSWDAYVEKNLKIPEPDLRFLEKAIEAENPKKKVLSTLAAQPSS